MAVPETPVIVRSPSDVVVYVVDEPKTVPVQVWVWFDTPSYKLVSKICMIDVKVVMSNIPTKYDPPMSLEKNPNESPLNVAVPVPAISIVVVPEFGTRIRNCVIDSVEQHRLSRLYSHVGVTCFVNGIRLLPVNL